MGKCHIQCSMELADFGIFRGQLVDLSRHSSQEDARAEAIDSVAFRALKLLRRKENLEKAELADSGNSGSEVSANSSHGDSADDLTDLKGLDVQDTQAMVDYINKVGSKLATCGNDDSGSETDRLRAVTCTCLHHKVFSWFFHTHIQIHNIVHCFSFCFYIECFDDFRKLRSRTETIFISSYRTWQPRLLLEVKQCSGPLEPKYSPMRVKKVQLHSMTVMQRPTLFLGGGFKDFPFFPPAWGRLAR